MQRTLSVCIVDLTFCHSADGEKKLREPVLLSLLCLLVISTQDTHKRFFRLLDVCVQGLVI